MDIGRHIFSQYFKKIPSYEYRISKSDWTAKNQTPIDEIAID